MALNRIQEIGLAKEVKKSRTKRLFISAFIAIAVLAYFGYGVIEPDTAAGNAVFHMAYSFPPTRPAVLRFYHWVLREFNGGYGSFDDVLLKRLYESHGSREFQAIIDFQIAQTPWRWRDWSQIPDDLKRKVLSDILRRLDSFSTNDTVTALALVESLRRSDPLHKGGLRGFRDGWDHPVRLDRLTLAKQCFRDWWADGSNWPANKDRNPLHDTEIVIFHGP